MAHSKTLFFIRKQQKNTQIFICCLHKFEGMEPMINNEFVRNWIGHKNFWLNIINENIQFWYIGKAEPFWYTIKADWI